MKKLLVLMLLLAVTLASYGCTALKVASHAAALSGVGVRQAAPANTAKQAAAVNAAAKVANQARAVSATGMIANQLLRLIP
ncbi:MAG: hypothetical protein M0P73_14795 [Syntrophobacterales bacterium]|jgi:hypothetical protein|nr:hypothetical protein [Syntrophobacterales bacterium]